MKPDDTSSEIAPGVDTRTEAEKDADRIQAEATRDARGATLVAAEEGDIAVNGQILTATGMPALEGSSDDWADVLIVANAPERMPAKKDRKVIVAEVRSQPDENGAGAGQDVEGASYPKSADAYVGWATRAVDGEEERVFGEVNGPVLLVGKTLKQFGIGGLSRQHGYVSVGPAHPVYAAVNLAHLQGAKKVEISGLTDHDKQILGPSLDRIAGEFENLSY